MKKELLLLSAFACALCLKAFHEAKTSKADAAPDLVKSPPEKNTPATPQAESPAPKFALTDLGISNRADF